MSADGSSPVERGMSLGYGYAESHRHDRRGLGRIARARSASEVITYVDPDQIGADGTEEPHAFWSGFAHGVQRYLLDEAHAP